MSPLTLRAAAHRLAPGAVAVALAVATVAAVLAPGTARAVAVADDGPVAVRPVAQPVTPSATPSATPLLRPVAQPARSAWGWPLGGTPEVLRAFDPPARRWSPGHRGVDLAAEPGSPVLSPVDGVVVFAGTVVDRGVVSIATEGGLRATLEPVTAEVGAGTVVRRGQRVGVVAASAHCGGRGCLHWGVRAGRDAYRDPLDLLHPAPPVLLPLGGAGGAVRLSATWRRSPSRAGAPGRPWLPPRRG